MTSRKLENRECAGLHRPGKMAAVKFGRVLRLTDSEAQALAMKMKRL